MNTKASSRFVYVVFATLSIGLMTLGMSAPASASEQTPFRATVTGTVSDLAGCSFPMVCSTSTDHGIATHLGGATLTKTIVVQITPSTCDNGGTFTTYTDYGTLNGANGDSIDLSGGGTACIVNGHAIAAGQLTVTGGTGRFIDATGTLAEHVDHNLVTDTEIGSLQGTVSSPGATAQSESSSLSDRRTPKPNVSAFD
jgi:hypothetical protein